MGAAAVAPPVPTALPPVPVVPPRPPEPPPVVPALPPPVPVVPPVAPEPPLPVGPPLPPLPLPPLPVVPPATQVPLVQCWFAGQAWPQLPQLASLLVVSTHAVPHIICPPSQLELQLLLLHTWLAWHIVAQLPQWVASEATQEPLHSSWPGWHWHWLFWQVLPPLQGMPQPPQLFMSEAVFTQSEPQRICPEAQLLPPPAPPVPAPLPPVPGFPAVDGVQAATPAATTIAKQSARRDTGPVFMANQNSRGDPN